MVTVNQLSPFEKALTINKYLENGKYSARRSENIRVQYRQKHPRVLQATMIIKCHKPVDPEYHHETAIRLLKKLFCRS